MLFYPNEELFAKEEGQPPRRPHGGVDEGGEYCTVSKDTARGF